MTTPRSSSAGWSSARWSSTRWSSARRSPYWLVLALVALSYVACATQLTPNPSSLALIVQLVTIAVTLHAARARPAVRRAAWIVIAVIAAWIVVGTLLGFEGHGLDIALSAISMLAYIAAPVAIILDQARRPAVDLQTLVAIVAAYLMVGMMFTFAFNLIALVSQVPTFGPGSDASLSSQLFFSFTTLTTTGYGNVVPVSSAVQSIAILEAVTGQLFLVIGVARIVNLRRTPAPGPARTEGPES